MVTEEFFTIYYPQFLAFATQQLGDKSLAQDVVQEAFISAFEYQDRFEGKSAVKTWVFAILKNKIIDQLRRNARYVGLSDMIEERDNASDELLLNTLFTQDGAWHKDTRPTAFDDSWADPDTHAENAGFWQVLEICLNNLPAEQAKVFLMKEYIELETEEICQHCQITQKNFYVLMYRARLRLQQCLQIKWFND